MTRTATLALVLGLTALAACTTVVEPQPRLDLHRSQPQTLVLHNSGDSPRTLQPQVEGIPPLRVAPGENERIEFTVLTVVDLIKREDHANRFRVLDQSARNSVEKTHPQGYLKKSGMDFTLRVQEGNASPSEHRINLNRCRPAGWEDAPAQHAKHPVDLANPPHAGVPLRICPDRDQ